MIVLKDLLSKLKNTDFKFSASSLTYNPMERFAEYVSTKEIVHSKIIAELLNPSGEHHLGYIFLITFLKQLGIDADAPTPPFNDTPICVESIATEFPAPVQLDGISYKGRIDIFVRLTLNGTRYAIIIENKLNDADDMYRQLERYDKFVEENYPDYHRVLVYMPRVGRECEYKSAIVINSTDLAEIIDRAIAECIDRDTAPIKAYSKYLKNISKYNIIMDNAQILAKMSAADIQDAKAIKEAYDKLPEAFAIYTTQLFNDHYKTQIPSKYPNYCYIWDQEAYNENSLWLAIGFTYKSYSIYVVSDNKTTYSNYLDKLNLSESDNYPSENWLRPINDNEFTKNFNGKPDFATVKQDAMHWLRLLKAQKQKG